MALPPKPKMTEKSLAAQPRRGGLSQPVSRRTTPRGQRISVWGFGPEGARYESHPSVPDRLARPFKGWNLAMDLGFEL